MEITKYDSERGLFLNPHKRSFDQVLLRFNVNATRAQTLRTLLGLSEIDCGPDRAQGFSGGSVSDTT